MAKYRHKDETELLWNRTRRILTRAFDTKVQNFREAALNDLLSGAYEKHSAALSQGKRLELSDNYEDWITAALRDAVEELTAIEDVNDAEVE